MATDSSNRPNTNHLLNFYMKTRKTLICLFTILAAGIHQAYGKQVKVELSTNGENSVPTKVTLFQDSAVVASQSFHSLKFALPDVAFNKLRLDAQNYKSVTLHHNSTDSLLRISLNRDTTLRLNEVVVTATTTVKTDGLNTKFINVSNGYLGKFHSGMETLEWTPGLMKINGIISIPGRGTPLIYIDNKRISSQKELNSILSEDISSIEIIREPGGEYPPGTTSVIRIKMKKHLQDFVTLSPRVSYTQHSHNSGFTTSLNSDFKFNKFSGTLSADYSHGGSRPSSTSNTVIFDSDTKMPKEEYNSATYNKYRSNDVQIFAGISFDINSKSRLQAQYSGVFNHGKTRTKTQLETLPPNHALQSYTERIHLTNHFHNAGLGYYLETEKTSFSIRASYNDIERDNDNYIFNAASSDNPAIISNPARYKAWLSYAELTQELGNGTLTAGYTATHSSNANNYISDNVGKIVDATNIVFSGYMSYSHNIKKVNLRGGLAYTYDYLKCSQTDIEPFSKRYNMVNPSASIKWNIKDKSLTLSYSRTGYAPQYYELNPNVEFIDSLNYYVGNLNLDYSKSNYLTLSFGSWKDFTSSLEYAWNNNSVVDSYAQYETKQNAILTRPLNGGHFKKVDFDITYNLWQRKFNVYASSIFSFSKNKYPVFSSTDTKKQFSWMLMLNARYTIAGKYNIFTNSWYKTPYQYGNMHIGHTLGVNLGASSSFLKGKLKVSLTCYDIFNNTVSPSSSRIFSNNVMRYSKFNYDGRCVTLSISYTFNKVKTTFERDDSYDNYTRRTESR